MSAKPKTKSKRKMDAFEATRVLDVAAKRIATRDRVTLIDAYPVALREMDDAATQARRVWLYSITSRTKGTRVITG